LSEKKIRAYGKNQYQQKRGEVGIKIFGQETPGFPPYFQTPYKETPLKKEIKNLEIGKGEESQQEGTENHTEDQQSREGFQKIGGEYKNRQEHPQ
jgi:hypothetical protein